MDIINSLKYILCFQRELLKKIVGKGENSSTQHSPFPTVFSAPSRTKLVNFEKFNFCRLKNYFNLVMAKILSFSKESTPSPNKNILDVTKLKAFADDKLNVDRMMISLLDRIENTEGKGENAGYQHFLLFLQCFPKP